MSKKLSPQEKVRRMWVRALRSGKYQKGTMKLRGADNTFCCLGVLCDLAVKQGVIPEPTLSKREGKYSYAHSTNFLPSVVKDWAGLKTTRGNMSANFGTSLANVNDYKYTEFGPIADLIESKPEGLFKEDK